MSAMKRFMEDVAEPVATRLGIDWGFALDLVMMLLVIEDLNPYSPDRGDMIYDAAEQVARKVAPALIGTAA